ncbi:MAG: hypothetical protein WBE91_06050 [Steroidobacteraceae bacterium]
MINFPSPLELAELVEPRSHLAKFELDKLVEGIRLEQQRLGNRPFLTILWLKLLDLDGYDNYLWLGESFENRDQAQAFVVAELADLLAVHTGANRQRPWREDPDRGCAAEGAAPGGTIPVCHEQTLSLTAGDYINRIYLRDQVLGPFPGAVVGHGLVAMLAGRYELSSYLRDVGGATLSNGPRRTPLAITRG